MCLNRVYPVQTLVFSRLANEIKAKTGNCPPAAAKMKIKVNTLNAPFKQVTHHANRYCHHLQDPFILAAQLLECFSYQSLTYHIPVSYLSHIGLLPITYRSLTYHIPVSYLSHAGLLPVSYMSLTNHLPISYLSLNTDGEHHQLRQVLRGVRRTQNQHVPDRGSV